MKINELKLQYDNIQNTNISSNEEIVPETILVLEASDFWLSADCVGAAVDAGFEGLHGFGCVYAFDDGDIQLFRKVVRRVDPNAKICRANGPRLGPGSFREKILEGDLIVDPGILPTYLLEFLMSLD